MKKTVYASIGIVALLAVIATVYFGVIGNRFAAAPEDGGMVDNGGEDTEMRDIIVEKEPTPVPPENSSELIADTSMPAPGYGPEFANLEITLNTGYPTVPATLPRYGMNYNTSMSIDEMEEIAALFGFSGGLYQERMMGPDEYFRDSGDVIESDAAVSGLAPEAVDGEAYPVDEEAVDGEDFVIDEEIAIDAYPPPFAEQNNYVAIDGSRRLYFYGSSASFQDMALMDTLWQPVSADQRLPYSEVLAIAESFLTSRDLLPDEYVSKAGWDSGIVQFYEILDGATFNRPVAVVHVNADKQIATIEYTPTIVLERMDDETILSAETAFASLQSNPQQYEFNYIPSEEMRFPEEMIQPNNWQRQFGADQTVTRMSWLQVFDSTDGKSQVIWADNMLVTGSAEIISELTETAVGRPVSLTGTMTEADGAKMFNVASFELNETPQEVYLSGQIDRDGDNTLLVVPGGLTLILPDAPVDLEAGINVNVYGWSISNSENGLPVFEWFGMDEQVDYRAFEEAHEADMGPFGANLLTVESVSLIFHPHYGHHEAFEEAMPMEPMEQFIPMWQFSGKTDQGATLEFWVPAIEVGVGN